MASRLDTAPTPPLHENFFRLPSFNLISNIEDSLPPYFAEIPPEYKVTFFTASGLNIEKNQMHGKSCK